MKTTAIRNRNTIPPSQSVRLLAAARTPDATHPQAADAPPIKFISKAKVLAMVDKTYPTVWKWMREGSFPRARNTGGSCSWIESEVQEWMANRPIQPLKGDEPATPKDEGSPQQPSRVF
jgi:predicted DNA-binding transcriptional regulator AlpA